MKSTVRTTSLQHSGLTADKQSLQKIGLLYAIATLVVITAAGLSVRHQLGASGDLIERAGVPSAAPSST